MNNWVSNEVERFQREISALEAEFAARKQQLFAKLAELLGVPSAPLKRKPGRPPKSAYGGSLFGAEPKRRGRKPGSKNAAGARPGRKPRGEETLPMSIVKVLEAAPAPLNAREILEGLQKNGWQTTSGDPQAMVYKTLHRIEKTGVVVKAERGRFVAPPK